MEKYGKDAWIAAKQFYKYLYDEDIQKFFYYSVIKEISELTKNKKTIHIFGFDTDPYKEIVNGVAVIPYLLDISINEKDIDQKGMWDDQRLNHLNDHNNKELADQIYLMLIQYNELNNNIAQLNLNRFDIRK